MPDQRIQDEAPAQDRSQRERQLDCIVLSFMFNEPSWPWSVEEIARELDDKDEAIEVVRRLTDSGLAHRLGEFVFPTRSARRAADIEIGTV
jgi:hypothetical protein